jgi:ACS family hexuronate transporter-like MFS transporter
MSQENGTLVPRYAWVILAVVYLASVSGTIMMNKVAPMMPALMDAFNADLTQAGLLVSVFGLTALFLALPAGMLVQKLGLKTTGMIALGVVAAGAAFGAISTSFGFLVASRVLEGIGTALIVILAPFAIAMWFPPEKSGMPMGIWSMTAPVGGFIAMTVAPILEPNIGWSGVWWATAGFTLVTLAVFWFFIRPAPSAQDADAPPADTDMKAIFSNKSLWLVGLAMLSFFLASIPLIVYYPTFLNTKVGYAMTRAGLMVSIVSLTTIPGSPLAGWLSDKFGTRRWIMILGFALLVPLTASVFQLSAGMISIAMILFGLVSSAVPTVIFAAAPEMVADPKMAGMGLAVVMLCLNLGMVIGPPIFGGLVESLGWVTAGYIFAAAPVLGILFTLLNRKLR